MDPRLLLPAMREVSLLVDPERPTKITQRAFDDTRTQSVVPNLPRAKRIVEQLNAKRDKRLTWARALQLAHKPEREQIKTTSTQNTNARTWLTEDQIIYALRYVAIRLDTKGFTRAAYENELEKMRSESIPVDDWRLPSGQQIVRALARKLRQREHALAVGLRVRQPPKKKSSMTVKAAPPTKGKRQEISQENAWKAALEMAGLQQVERAYLPSPSVSTIELLERCFAKHKTQLTRDEAREFARANNIPYSFERQKLGWGESVIAWKKRLEARRIVPPKGPPPRAQRPDYTRNVGAGRPVKTRRVGWTDLDACLADVRPYLEQLPAGEHSTRGGFQRWLEAQGRTPPSRDAFKKHGGWNHVRRRAYERIYPGLNAQDAADQQKDRERDQQSAQKTRSRTKTVAATERNQPPTTGTTREARASTPEPTPGQRLRALSFGSRRPKKRQTPRRKASPSRTA
jgi:hypothetical protein